MAEDDGAVAAGDIGKRLNAKSNVVANYRARLIAAGLIEAPAYGKEAGARAAADGRDGGRGPWKVLLALL